MKKVVCCVLVMLMAVSLFAGCGKKEVTEADYQELISQKAEENRKTVILTLTGPNGTKEITKDMMMYYLAYYERTGVEYDKENGAYFQAIYGDEYKFWEMTGEDNRPMKETYLNAAFSAMVYTTIMYEDAVAAGLTLDDTRAKSIERLVANFLANYTMAERARCGLDEKTLTECYERILLAGQYEEYVTANVTVDQATIEATLNKEDYRVYETDYVYVATRSYDEDFQIVEYGEAELTLRKNAIEDAYNRAQEGSDLRNIQKVYSTIMTYANRDFYRNDSAVEKEYINTVLEMQVGDIASLTTEGGVYVIKLIDNTQYVGYDNALESALQTAKDENVAKAYAAIEAKYSMKKEAAFDKIEMGKIYSAE